MAAEEEPVVTERSHIVVSVNMNHRGRVSPTGHTAVTSTEKNIHSDRCFGRRLNLVMCGYLT